MLFICSKQKINGKKDNSCMNIDVKIFHNFYQAHENKLLKKKE